MTWTPGSWREHPATQMPDYPDAAALETVESCLAAAPPLVDPAGAAQLRTRLAEVAEGRRFLLQGGDCAETFAEFGADKVRTGFNLLLRMAATIREGGGMDVETVARMAGQFAKPRSSSTEEIDGRTLPSYRGDMVNGPEPTIEERTPDPARMLEGYRQSSVTLDLIRAYAAAAYADSSDIHRAARARLGLAFEHAAPEENAPVRVFTSHEALLLPYEQALTRWDPTSERWWALSAHMLWIGDRTRQLDGAHVHFASGIANPIGVKCGPGIDADDLLRLIERLDPANEPGRLVLIGRFGASEAGRKLPELMRATQQAGSHAVWTIDPMHGNTVSAGDRKTRLVGDILAETRTFFSVARAEGAIPGGVHLELTGSEVTECLGGSKPLREADLSRRYLSHCDPRLNQDQALDVAAEISRLVARKTHRANAA